MQLEDLIVGKRTSKLFILALFVSLGVVLWQTAALTRRHALHELEQKSRNRLQLYVSNLQGRLEKYEFLPELLATNDELLRLLQNPSDPDRIDALNRYLETINKIANASDTYLMDAEGLTIAASNWQLERPFVGRNFSYRPYFQEAMKGELGRYFALGMTSNKRGYYFAYPVRYRESILGAVVIKINMAPVEESWRQAENDLIVTDPDGVIFITTQKNWRYKTLGPLEPEVMARIKESKRYADEPLDALNIIKSEGVSADSSLIKLMDDPSTEYLMLERPMPEAGWKVNILTKTAVVTHQVVRNLLAMLIIIVIAVLFILFRVQRLKRYRERERFKRQAQKNLERNEAQIRAIFENTQAGLMTLDEEWRIELVNSKALELFAYAQDQLSGLPFLDCFYPDVREQVAEMLRNEGPVVTLSEVEARRKDGSVIPIELSIGSLYLESGRKRIVTIHDISFLKKQETALRLAHDQLESRVDERTRDLMAINQRLVREIDEHRQTEEALRRTQDELIQAAKMAALGQMSTGISHELNQPLAAIRSYADNARALLDHDRIEDVRWNLAQISGLTERMAQISSQLKVFARKTSGRLVSVSFTAVMDTTVKILAPRTREAKAVIEVALPEEELYVLADMVQLEQVMVNLIGNALHAVESQAVRRVEVRACARGDEVRVTIRDTGPGIAPDHLQKVFDPFFTTKEKGRGLGLGLSISHRIVEGMKGSLSAGNDPDGGAIFTLSLPRAKPPEEHAIGESDEHSGC